MNRDVTIDYEDPLNQFQYLGEPVETFIVAAKLAGYTKVWVYPDQAGIVTLECKPHTEINVRCENDRVIRIGRVAVWS
jgi:hypothetical protein